jgi:hypothetical protein
VLSGRFSTVVLKNSHLKQKAICGKIIGETNHYVLVKNVHTKDINRYKKSTIKYIQSGKNKFEKI